MQNLGINLVKVDNTVIEVSYIDSNIRPLAEFNSSSYVKILTKRIYLSELRRTSDTIEKRVYNYFRDNTSNDKIPLEVSKINLKTITLEKALKRANIIFCHYNSFYDNLNQIILNSETKKKFFEDIKGFNLVINEYVPDNFIYLTKKDAPDRPGIAYYYTDVEMYNGTVRYDVIASNSPQGDKQAMKLEIIP